MLQLRTVGRDRPNQWGDIPKSKPLGEIKISTPWDKKRRHFDEGAKGHLFPMIFLIDFYVWKLVKIDAIIIDYLVFYPPNFCKINKLQ